MAYPQIFSITNATSGTASFTSSAFWLWDVIRISAQAVVSSGSVAGIVSLQVSNDTARGAFQTQFQPTNWNTVGTSTSTPSVVIASSTATGGAFLFPAVDINYSYGRFVFTDLSAGSAVGTFNINVKTYGL